MQGIPVQNKGPLLIEVATLLSSNLHQAVQVLKRLEDNKKNLTAALDVIQAFFLI